MGQIPLIGLVRLDFGTPVRKLFQCFAAQTILHALTVTHAAVLARCLGSVERAVGPLEQFLEGHTLACLAGQADAAGKSQPVQIFPGHITHHANDFPGAAVGGRFTAHIGHINKKLVASDSSDHSRFAEQGRQLCRQLHQDSITEHVAAAVIDAFKVVYIQHHQCG